MAEEKKKSATIFDFMNGMMSDKKEWNKWSESDQKLFTPFITNRWLSMRQDLIGIVNELQIYTIGLLKPRDTYRLYHAILPTNKTYPKYVKGKKDDKYAPSLISQLAEHFQVSKSEATEYVDLMSADQCERIIRLYGYKDSEVKTMLKGVK